MVEGYDGFDVAPRISQYNYSHEHFIDQIRAPFPAYDFNEKLDEDAGYDLLFVDFNQGTDNIVSNAALVEEIIGIINGTTARGKVNDDRFGNVRQQNVVLGQSMGGLVARYALARMTKNNIATETRLLITHDSPHRGANIPLGLQYLLNMAGEITLFGFNVGSIFPQYTEAVNLLARPASQQLLIYRATGATTFTNNSFLDGAYRSMITFSASDPQPSYRFIATSLGSECANPRYAPYNKLIDASTSSFLFFIPGVPIKTKATAEAYGLPATGQTSKIASINLSGKFKLFGFITIAKSEYNNTAYAPGSQLPIDGAPGSSSFFANEVPSFNNSPFIPFIRAFGITGYASANIHGAPGQFTYVPVVSALDVNPFNISSLSQAYTAGFNQNYPSTSETYIAQEINTTTNVSNVTHLQYTARNAEWLFREMENLPNTLNCSNYCPNTYFITGNNPICNAELFSVGGLPRGATVTWSASPPGL